MSQIWAKSNFELVPTVGRHLRKADLKEIASNFSLFLIRFAIFRRILDAEMKEGTRAGVGLKTKKEMYCKL